MTGMKITKTATISIKDKDFVSELKLAMAHIPNQAQVTIERYKERDPRDPADWSYTTFTFTWEVNE